jgi:hypothetical protein
VALAHQGYPGNIPFFLKRNKCKSEKVRLNEGISRDGDTSSAPNPAGGHWLVAFQSKFRCSSEISDFGNLFSKLPEQKMIKEV